MRYFRVGARRTPRTVKILAYRSVAFNQFQSHFINSAARIFSILIVTDIANVRGFAGSRRDTSTRVFEASPASN